MTSSASRGVGNPPEQRGVFPIAQDQHRQTGVRIPATSQDIDVIELETNFTGSDHLGFVRLLNGIQGPAIFKRYSFMTMSMLLDQQQQIFGDRLSTGWRNGYDISMGEQAENFQRHRSRPWNEALQDSRVYLSQYDHLVKAHKFIPQFGHLHMPPINPTVLNWLLNGPSFYDNFHHPSWAAYFLAVKRLLSDPASQRWLDADIGTFLNRDGQEGRTGPQQPLHPPEQQRNLLPTDTERVGDAAQINHDNPRRANSVRRLPALWFSWLYDKLFTPLATTVCILNITSALGYVMLMNDTAEPKAGFKIGYITTWLTTCAILMHHHKAPNMFTYACYLFPLSVVMCFATAFVFHFAGASNFASSFLFGISIAVISLLLWM